MIPLEMMQIEMRKMAFSDAILTMKMGKQSFNGVTTKSNFRGYSGNTEK